MAKKKYTTIGSIIKNKDSEKANYVKVNLYKRGEITLKNGQYINVESKKFKLENAERLLQAGKITQEAYEKIVERAEAMPDFVLAELVVAEEA